MGISLERTNQLDKWTTPNLSSTLRRLLPTHLVSLTVFVLHEIPVDIQSFLDEEEREIHRNYQYLYITVELTERKERAEFQISIR